MSRYIDVDEEIRKINETIFEKERDGKANEFTTYCFKIFADALSKAPTADVEEVVRCRCCKYKRVVDMRMVCSVSKQTTLPDGYCWRGKKE